MKILPMVGVGCLLSLAQFAQASEKPKFVSRTFQDILRRVNDRDKEIGAIKTVQSKDSEGQILAGGMHFSIEDVSDPLHGQEVVVTLSRNYLTGPVVYEQHRLHIDDAIAEELLHQKKLKENEEKQQQKLAAEHAKWQEEQTHKIEQATGGTLKFGMSRKEIEKIKGQPISIEVSPLNGLVQSALLSHYYFTLTYPDMELKFDRVLIDVKVTKEPLPAPPAATPPPDSTHPA